MAVELMNMTLCPNCNRILNYDLQGIIRDADGYTYVKCPQCGKHVYIK